MMTHTPTTVSARGSGRPRWRALMVAFVALLFTANVFAQAPAAAGGAGAALPADELEQLVGRIALYPDDLVAIILPAATNPLQIVQADRFLEKRKADPNSPLDDKWDDAVKSLLNYPEIVKTMSGDLDWTAALGEAVVEDQGEVLEAIQAYRRKVQAAGNLKSDPKQTVVVEKEVIKIVPADPQVIYVPQYNPSTVVVSGGYSSWGYYPSPYPVYYYPYPPGAALATGIIWGAALGAVWHGGHYGAHYGGGGNNNINIDRSTNINTGGRGGTAGQRPAGSTSQWKSNKQPGQVSGSVGKTSSSRAGDARGGGGAGGARASAQPAGGRDIGGGGGARDAGGGAFGGANTSGRQAQMDSSRGAASRGSSPGAGAGAGARPSPSMSGAGARPSPSPSAGARGGGGGGGARGGGGGGRGGGGGGGRR